jgi:hypothetical protein
MNKAGGKRKRILFFEGFRHFYGIMRSRDMADLDKIHLEKSLGPSIMLKLYAAGVRIESLDRDRPVESGGIKFPVDEAKSSLRGFFTFEGNDFFSVAWPRLEFLLTEFFPRVMCPHLASVIRTLDAARPDCVVVENDNTYNEKMVVAVSARKGIRTVVVQNGAMWLGSSCGNPGISVHDFYPLIADNFMAFGEVNKEWYAKMGADPRKVIVTGAARFDHYYREKRSQEKVIGARRTVLVLLSDVGSEEGVVTQDMPLGEIKAHINKYLELAFRNPGIDIIVRPHHDEGLWRELFAAELAKAPNLVISRKGSLAELFGKVDAVVGYVSTALIEALIMRIPVISVDVDGKCAPFPLWEYGLSKRVSSFKELEPVLTELLYDGRKRSQFMGEIDKNIGLFNLKDDGNAAGRVTLKLREMLLEPPLK